VLVGQARNKMGQTVRSRLRTPEGYSLTAATAFDAASRVASGDIKPGFQTPSLAFGADYVLNFDGVTRGRLSVQFVGCEAGTYCRLRNWSALVLLLSSVGGRERVGRQSIISTAAAAAAAM
jgi:hypothetical protein